MNYIDELFENALYIQEYTADTILTRFRKECGIDEYNLPIYDNDMWYHYNQFMYLRYIYSELLYINIYLTR